MCFTTAENGHCGRAEDAAVAVHERATSSGQLTTLRLTPQLLDLLGMIVGLVDVSFGCDDWVTVVVGLSFGCEV